jgi:hypothetical protein
MKTTVNARRITRAYEEAQRATRREATAAAIRLGFKLDASLPEALEREHETAFALSDDDYDEQPDSKLGRLRAHPVSAGSTAAQERSEMGSQTHANGRGRIEKRTETGARRLTKPAKGEVVMNTQNSEKEMFDTVQTSLGVMEILWPSGIELTAPPTLEMRIGGLGGSTWVNFEFGREGWQPGANRMNGVELELPTALARELIKIATEWARENQAGYVARCREDFATFVSGSLGLIDDGYMYPTVEEIDELIEGRLNRFISPELAEMLKKAKAVAARIDAAAGELENYLTTIQEMGKTEFVTA